MLVTIIPVNLGQLLQVILSNIHSLTEVNRKAAWISEQNLNDPQFPLCFTSMSIAHIDILVLSKSCTAERSPRHSRHLSLPTSLPIYPKTGRSFFLSICSNKRVTVFPETIPALLLISTEDKVASWLKRMKPVF